MGIIKDGYHEQVDNFRQAKTKGKTWLAELEASEREKTGIRTLKIKYNKVFGYYLEVTNSFKDMVPDYYTRKQTLTNAGALYHSTVKRTGRYDFMEQKISCMRWNMKFFPVSEIKFSRKWNGYREPQKRLQD